MNHEIPPAAPNAIGHANLADAREIPVRVDAKTGAALIKRYFFPVSPRTLERWPLRIRHVNGKALIETSELFAIAQAKLEEAPIMMRGRRPVAQGGAA
jgi:hypothetical protein